MKELLEKFNYNLVRFKKLPEVRDLYKSKVKRENNHLKELEDKILLIQDSRMAYQKIIDEFYKQSIGELESLINCALSTIFFDRHYKIQIALSDESKKDKSFSFDIINEDIGEPESLVDGNGAGIRAVISFVILSYYLIRFNSPYIFFDECLSQISKEYVDAFFQFVHKLCEEQGLILVLISHDSRLIPYADQLIQISEGRVTVHNNLDESQINNLIEQIEEYENENKA